MPVSPKELAERIEGLSANDRAEIEELVNFLIRRHRGEAATGRSETTFSQALVDRINERRERLRREHGVFDVLPLIRDFRESGGR